MTRRFAARSGDMQGPMLRQRHLDFPPRTLRPDCIPLRRLHRALSLSRLTVQITMKPLSRSFATVSKGPAARRLRGQRVLGLEHFVQRQRVLTLWRDILRTTAFIPDPGLRKDMRQTAREKFEQHRNVTDLGHIRYLISVRFAAIGARFASDLSCRLGKLNSVQ